MNEDISSLIEFCILDLYRCVKPDYERWRTNLSQYSNEDPLSWLYLSATEMIIKQRMKDSGVEMELFDDIYFSICWEIREKSMVG